MENFFEVLKNNPLFKGLDESGIETVLKRVGARRRAITTDEYILRIGDKTMEMGFVLSGSVLVIQEDLWGRRNIMSRVFAGDIFAEIFATAGAPLNVSVVAHEDGEVLFLDVNRLFLLQGSGGTQADVIIHNLLTALARKTMAFNEKITHISKRSTRDKLLSYLSAQSVRQGSLSFSISFDRQQLADYLCVERAAMCVELSKLQKEGVLIYRKNHFRLTALTEV